MIDSKKYFVYLFLGIIGFSTLLFSNAYADFKLIETYQGTASTGSMSSQSWLEWTITSSSGSESGRTNSILALPQLSFLADSSLTNVLEISVIGVMDQSNIGINYCFTTPNWNFDDIVKVNGISYDLADALLTQNTEGNPIFKGKGLKFVPNLIERLLEIKGVTLQNGDIIQWQVTANNRFDLYEGVHTVGDDRTNPKPKLDSTATFQEQFDFGSGFFPNTDGKGTCIVKEHTVDFDGFLVQRPVLHQIFYTTGMKFSVDMTWVDIAIQTISLNPTINDLDGDGIPDHLDLCTFTAENFNSYQDEDGCPDVIPLTPEQQEFADQELDDDEIIIIDEDGNIVIVPNLDNDNDGFPNDIDLCPDEPENFNGIQDFDGCPDGAITNETNLVDNEGNPIVFDEETNFPLIGSDDGSVFDFIAENTDDFNPTIIILEPSTGIETDNGISDECNPIFENCSLVIAQAIQQVEEATGIKLPFEPSILNFVIIFGIIGFVLFMVGKATKKI